MADIVSSQSALDASKLDPNFDYYEVPGSGGRQALRVEKGTDVAQVRGMMDSYAKGMFKLKPDALDSQRAPKSGKELLWDVAGDAARAGATGIVKGASSLAAAPRIPRDLTDAAIGYVAPKLGATPEATSAAQASAQNVLDNVPGFGPATRDWPTHRQVEDATFGALPEGLRREPQGGVERFVHDAGELAASAPARSMLLPSVIAAGAGEAGRQLAPAGAEDPASFLAKMLTLFGTAWSRGRVAGTAGEMIKRRTEGMTDADWAAAQARQEAAAQAGAPILGPEALDNPSMHRLAGDTRASATGGPPMEARLAQRPGEVRTAVGGQLDAVAPASDPRTIVEGVQNAASAVIERMVQGRTAATAPLYDNANATRVPQPDIDYLAKLLEDAAAKQGPTVAGALLAMRDKLFQNPTVGGVSSEVKALKESIEQASRGAQVDATMQAPRAVAATGGPALSAVEQTLEAVSPSYAAGQDRYRAMSPAVDQMRASPIGELATKRPDEIANPTATQGRQIDILANPTAATPGTIRHIARNLSAEDPTVFQDFVGNHLRQRFDAATKEMRSGEQLEMGPKFRQAIFGTDQEKANLRTMIEEAARASGNDPAGAWAGFNRLLEALGRQGKIPGIGSPTATRGSSLNEAAAGSIVGNTLEAIQIADPLRAVRRAFYDLAQRGTMRKLGETFTRPDSVAAMRELAMTAPNTARERYLLSSLFGLEQANQQQDRANGER